MLVIGLLELYSAFLSSFTICYIIYKLNTDLKRVPMINYILCGLVITVIETLVNLSLPDLNVFLRVMIFSLSALFVILIFNRYSIYHTTISVFFSMLIVGLGDLLVTLVYVYPLRLTRDEYRSNYIHMTLGGLLIFLFCYFILRLISDNFMKARKRVYKKHNRFTILLCGNLITVFVILLFVFSLFNYTIEFQGAIKRSNTVFMSAVFVLIVLIASIVGTVYLINYFLLNRIKYDRLKMNNIKDVMTGTLNRGSGIKFIEDQLDICKRMKKSLTICYIDVNDLKVINDMLGHKEGDYLIKTIVRTIKENIRETDVISRLGGDEFVIVFPGCTMDYTEKVMDRISGKLRQLKPFSNKDYTISISYGFSQYDGEVEITVDGLLDKADHQMYQNKRALKAMA
ncbi:MAG: hypothetical protein K0R50_1394 [Eubacterium sp.]|nr:hypothetical protein [Eubacterium sp.]